MIFATVGAQMPFDRLIHALDVWAAAHPEVDVFAQVGDTARPPAHMPFEHSLPPAVFVDRVRSAGLVVAHAGMGSILTALEHARPILVMPRRGDLRETRNDHQVATARRFAASGQVLVAFDACELGPRLDEFLSNSTGRRAQSPAIGPFASHELIQSVRSVVWGVRTPHAPQSVASPPRSSPPDRAS